MLNPIFWLISIFVFYIIMISLTKWEKGILFFFFYIQFAGFFKRIMLSMGYVNNVLYNFFVGYQYLILFSLIVGAIIFKNRNNLKSNSFISMWVIVFILLLIISSFLSPYSLNDVIFVSILHYFPLFILLPSQFLSKEYLNKLLSLWYYTAPIHIFYQIFQYFHGPFSFELNFLLTKSSLSHSFDSSFVRGIPLYDNVEPLYLHLTIVAVLILSKRKTIVSFVYLFLLLLSVVQTGNRGGVLIVVGGMLLFTYLKTQLPFRKSLVLFSSVFIIFSLNFFSDFLWHITQLGSINLGNSDFFRRLGTLGTFSDRLMGRQIAFEHISLFGHGFGTSGFAMNTLRNKGLDATLYDRSIFAHDLIGEIILDFGIIGLFVFMILLWKIYKKLNTKYFFYSVITSSFLISSLIGSSLTFGRSAYFVFLLIAVFFNNYLTESTFN